MYLVDSPPSGAISIWNQQKKMSTLATHFSAFLFLFPIGIRRLICSSSLYLKNPSLYRSRIWYFTEPKWKNFDFYILLIVLPIASLSELFFFLTLPGNPTFQFGFLQGSTVVFSFWLLYLLIIFRENWDPFLVPESFIFICAGILFVTDYMTTGKGLSGLAGSVYEMLGLLTLYCAAFCVYLSMRPAAFFAEFMLSSGLIFKGTWALQTGLSFYTDTFALKGCDNLSISPVDGRTDVKCDLEEFKLRGEALMLLLFIVHATAVFIVCLVLFGVCNRRLKQGGSSGSLLAELQAESGVTRTVHEFELE